MNQASEAPVQDTSSPRRRGPLRRIIRNWRQRHRHPFNFWIHMIGIPLALIGVALFFMTDWIWAVAAIVLGYALQFWGHAREGNDVGEWAALKRMLGLPYIGIAPRPGCSGRQGE
jgi:hypothetical protein